MAMLGPPISAYAELFAQLQITADLCEALGDDEDSWADLLEGDLAAVAKEHRAELVAAMPTIAETAAAAAGS